MTERPIEPSDNLGRYLAEIRRYAYLTAEQELELTQRWRDERDPEALRLLIGSHLRLVVKMARGYSGYGLPLGELISQGHLGLMQAVAKFDPDRGVRFATYATWWIRASMREYVMHSWSIVKTGTTASQKKLFFNLRRMKHRMREFEQAGLSPRAIERIADELEVPAQDVMEMNDRLSSHDKSLNTTLNATSQDEWQDLLIEEAPDPEVRAMEQDELDWRRGLLETGLVKLNDRERRILEERRLKDEPPTLETLSREYGISRERVRQIENRAYDKLRAAMVEAA